MADGIYDGAFKEGKMEGHGMMTYKDGRTFKGRWRQEKHHGFGAMTWPDGRSFKG
jgi:hypothetical protein